MKEVYETSSGTEEVRGSALKNTGAGRKPGDNIFVSISKAIGLFFLSQLISTVAVLGYIVFNSMNEVDDNGYHHFEIGMNNLFDKNSLLIFLLTEIFMIAIFVLYGRFKEIHSFKTLGFTKKNLPLSYLAGILGAGLSMTIITLVCKLTGAFVFVKSEFSVPSMLLFALGWVIQGLAEEVMCRGFLMNSIARRYSMKTAVIANSVVFALLHMFNPSGVPFVGILNLILFGIFASLMFLYTENIWMCAAFHTVWNFIQGNVIGIPVSGIKVPAFLEVIHNEDLALIHGGNFGVEGGLPVTVIMLTGCILLFFLIKKKPENKLFDKA